MFAVIEIYSQQGGAELPEMASFTGICTKFVFVFFSCNFRLISNDTIRPNSFYKIVSENPTFFLLTQSHITCYS